VAKFYTSTIQQFDFRCKLVRTRSNAAFVGDSIAALAAASGTHARTDCARTCDEHRDEQNRAAAEMRPGKDYFLR
jgi:hypothetical protein